MRCSCKASYLQARAVGDVKAAKLSQHGQATKASSRRPGKGCAAPKAQIPQVLQRRQLTSQLIRHVGL